MATITKVTSSAGATKSSKPIATRELSSRNSDLSSSTTADNGTERQVKRLPPIKAPVGLAKSPDLKNCKSKVGSLNNIKHSPAGSGVTIPSQKLKWEAKSKVGSLDNKEHKPGGGKLKVESRKLEWKTSSKVQSLQNVNHKPGGGNVKIFNESYFDKNTSSVKKNRTPDGDSKPKPSDENNNGLTDLSKKLNNMNL